jgi:hypothetical protein
VRYCSKTCQKEHYLNHKKHCLHYAHAGECFGMVGDVSACICAASAAGVHHSTSTNKQTFKATGCKAQIVFWKESATSSCIYCPENSRVVLYHEPTHLKEYSIRWFKLDIDNSNLWNMYQLHGDEALNRPIFKVVRVVFAAQARQAYHTVGKEPNEQFPP